MWKGILLFLSYSVIVSTEILLSLLITACFRAVKIEKVKKKSQNSLKTDDNESLSGYLY